MTLTDAREVRDLIRENGLHCIVPLGYGPKKYFARIFLGGNAVHDFKDRPQARKYLAAMHERQRKTAEERRKVELILRHPPARSPLEAMIDKACGL